MVVQVVPVVVVLEVVRKAALNLALKVVDGSKCGCKANTICD